jgi:putative transcriptional regulator
MKNRIRVLRAERRWSQAELADRIGVSRQTVNAVENDKYDPSLPLAFKIAIVFETPIETIFQYEGIDEGTAASHATAFLDGPANAH